MRSVQNSTPQHFNNHTSAACEIPFSRTWYLHAHETSHYTYETALRQLKKLSKEGRNWFNSLGHAPLLTTPTSQHTITDTTGCCVAALLHLQGYKAGRAWHRKDVAKLRRREGAMRRLALAKARWVNKFVGICEEYVMAKVSGVSD